MAKEKFFASGEAKNSRAGFTLVEVLTALAFVVIGISAGYELVNQTLMAVELSSMRLEAAYLGKEGIEIVKSIRDSNYLKIHYDDAGETWMTGLDGCAGGCGADYTSAALSPTYKDVPLNFDGHYRYCVGCDATRYIRNITVDTSVYPVPVIVTVGWQEKGREHSIVVQENLYNWWQ